MPVWPAALPQYPLLNSFVETSPSAAILRTQMDVGPAKARRRSTAEASTYAMTFAPVDASARLAFVDFYLSDIGSGSLPFDLPHPLTGVVGSWRFASAGQHYVLRQFGAELQLKVTLELLP